MITRLPRRLLTWRAVTTTVTKQSQRYQQQVHFHNAAVKDARIHILRHQPNDQGDGERSGNITPSGPVKISYIPSDNPVTRLRHRLDESSAVVLNLNNRIVRFTSLFLRDSCECTSTCSSLEVAIHVVEAILLRTLNICDKIRANSATQVSARNVLIHTVARSDSQPRRSRSTLLLRVFMSKLVTSL